MNFFILLACIFAVVHAQPPIFKIQQSEWTSLNKSIGGKLFAGTPMSLPCFSSYNNGTGYRYHKQDIKACAAVTQGKTDGPSITNYFGGYEVPNWGQCMAKHTGCTLSGFLPVDPITPIFGRCDQGSVPQYYIDSADPSHIHAGIVFAQKHKIPLVVKNTGHDHRGRSSAPNSLAIWTHNIQPELVFDTDFKPVGCSGGVGAALTYGAGYMFGQLYDAAHARSYMIAGGASLSVGASGGYTAGGGHGALTNSYGLAVDNVLQLKVLLANGTIATANRCQNKDLFFALRGGGGGTFGVVLETTSRLHREVPMQGSKYLQLLLDNAEKWADEGWGGYILPGLLSGTLSTFAAITPSLTLEEAKASMKPIVDFATSLGNINVPLTVNITTLPHGFYDFLQTPDAQTVGGFTGLNYALVSRLVPRANFKTPARRQELLNVLNEMNKNKLPNPVVPFYILMTTPAAYKLPASDELGGPGEASVTPAWRNSLWQFEMPAVWDPQDSTALLAGSDAKAFDNAHRAINPLRTITPNSGAYQNEADIFEPGSPNAFWGRANYNRLLKIKKASGSMPSATQPESLADPARPLAGPAIPANPPDLSNKIPKLEPRRTAPKQARKPPSTPGPETPTLSPPPTSPELSHPTRRILSPRDHELFLASPTYQLITSFVFTVADSVHGTPISSISKQSLHPFVISLLSILDVAQTILDENPPENTGSRFGNPIFKSFLSSLTDQATSLHTTHFPNLSPAALDEVTTYFISSFGSGLRIDYGSGHELNYFMYLLCLNRLSLLPPTTFPSLALVLFPRYIALMRNLQTAYYLEPAGSHGVWGLDDYHFLPFLFGANQLAAHPFIRPLAIHSQPTLDAYADDFLYLDMVRHVNATKTVQGLRWHSPMLDDISGVRAGWAKIYAGMRKMFASEVLGKLVVMQHFLFGGLLPAAEGMTAPDADEGDAGTAPGDGEVRVAEGHEGHAHNVSAWGDCCGIKVPSSVGARQEMRKRMGGEGLRRLPFD
ncbi:hypothetical protein FH972_026530 [Carpinus fangiana]|uniref:peptidylprolyl isomerase n=1 Tax=Carpinus fangiana TaxID=176857 RepID=A0A5N6L4A8_9ROSI|nr:hypothetical protein FH972_026530 [Carpinus fangiana]